MRTTSKYRLNETCKTCHWYEESKKVCCDIYARFVAYREPGEHCERYTKKEADK